MHNKTLVLIYHLLPNDPANLPAMEKLIRDILTADEKAKAASQVESALGRLLVITENYPVLQSSQAYRDLMTSLEGTENRISVERMKYNDLVKVFDTNVKTFPTSLVAKLFGVTERAYFEVPTEAKVVPKVSF